ncbi:hypothetical protein BCF11_0145 [Collimonas sp. PA-H2]|uniref:DUF6582 domain-containing protein n=1 Tax=Collimonas sp. PA-H2 TaxID=1881062 RepID=UPI000BF8D6E6|nr:DUF6582 domain-containing protein [Collimonas sp. PA-H2]PFH07805.1 hypothetical protein BCF11_0145 [Collimonas sp. PA-H2]
MSQTTWKPHAQHGELSSKDRDHLPESAFAFPKQRKEPMTNSSHVRSALAQFDQVDDVSDGERDIAFENIKAAAKHFGVEMTETSWKELGKNPHTKNHSHK